MPSEAIHDSLISIAAKQAELNALDLEIATSETAQKTRDLLPREIQRWAKALEARMRLSAELHELRQKHLRLVRFAKPV